MSIAVKPVKLDQRGPEILGHYHAKSTILKLNPRKSIQGYNIALM